MLCYGNAMLCYAIGVIERKSIIHLDGTEEKLGFQFAGSGGFCWLLGIWVLLALLGTTCCRDGYRECKT